MNRHLTTYFTAGVVTTLAFVYLSNLLSRKASCPRLSTNSRKKILFFGDSITQHGFNPSEGWISNLAYWWSRRVDILNRGFSGYNSKWGLRILKEVVIDESPDLIFVFFGANDAVDVSIVQHISLSDYNYNMLAIINELKQALPYVPVVIITPPPVWEPLLEETNRQKGKLLTRDRTNDRTKQYVSICKEIGHQLSVPVVDLWTALQGETDNRQEFLIDGLHLNSRGNIALFKEVKKLLGERLPEWLPELMPMHMPEWSQILPGDPKFT